MNRHVSALERINYFRGAGVVIGPLGQGLTDILFCKPGALLWEWMPRHHQNASINRLAQAAGLDYWGDIFESDLEPASPGRWSVDWNAVNRRLPEISQRLAARAASGSSMAKAPRAPNQPLDELMLAFESLGDNCEFGLVQRHAGVEPLGLFRFAGIHLEKLIDGLNTEFDGMGEAGTVSVYLAGEAGRREFMVKEATYGLHYHSGVLEGEAEPAAQVAREVTRLRFLRRKLLEDLRTGEKVWVWRALTVTDRARVDPLLEALRSRGPNTLLWVAAADAEHRSGTVECLAADFMKGYVERLAPYENATDITPIPWFVVCQVAYNLCHPDETVPEEPERLASPYDNPVSAMEFLSRHKVTVQAAPITQPDGGKGLFSRLRRAVGL